MEVFKDDARWSDDFSPVRSSDFVWLFATTGLDRDLFCIATREECRTFRLPRQTNLQLAMLDLDYWANVADTRLNANRIARYLETLRSEVHDELELQQTWQPLACIHPWQPETTRPWAIRTKHGFGHSFFGRSGYLGMCSINGWIPYLHENPASYGMSTSFSYK